MSLFLSDQLKYNWIILHGAPDIVCGYTSVPKRCGCNLSAPCGPRKDETTDASICLHFIFQSLTVGPGTCFTWRIFFFFFFNFDCRRGLWRRTAWTSGGWWREERTVFQSWCESPDSSRTAPCCRGWPAATPSPWWKVNLSVTPWSWRWSSLPDG